MQLLQIDAFTSEAFRGNPATVCFLDDERDDVWMQAVAAEMNLSETVFFTPAEAPSGLLEALGVGRAVGVYRNQFDFMIEVPHEAAVVALTPQYASLRDLPARGVIVTAAADANDIDFVSRFFGPGSGVDEDPVTGSAHCALGPFWGERFGRTELTGYQASSRGGVVRVQVAGDRVMLGGHAVTVMRGELVC